MNGEPAVWIGPNITAVDVNMNNTNINGTLNDTMVGPICANYTIEVNVTTTVEGLTRTMNETNETVNVTRSNCPNGYIDPGYWLCECPTYNTTGT